MVDAPTEPPSRVGQTLAVLAALATLGLVGFLVLRVVTPPPDPYPPCMAACMAGDPEPDGLPAWCAPGQRPPPAPSPRERQWLCELQCRPDPAP